MVPDETLCAKALPVHNSAMKVRLNSREMRDGPQPKIVVMAAAPIVGRPEPITARGQPTRTRFAKRSRAPNVNGCKSIYVVCRRAATDYLGSKVVRGARNPKGCSVCWSRFARPLAGT